MPSPYWCCAQLENYRVHLALHCLQLAGYDTYAPRLRTYRVSHGRRIEGRPLLFPSYVFVAIVAQWHAARWAPGVVRLVGMGPHGDTAPARVPDGVIAELRARERPDCQNISLPLEKIPLATPMTMANFARLSLASALRDFVWRNG